MEDWRFGVWRLEFGILLISVFCLLPSAFRLPCFYHETDCAQSAPKAMGGARLVHNPDLVVLIGRGHKINERRVKIHIVPHQNSIGGLSFFQKYRNSRYWYL